MPNIKISQLPAGTTPITGVELIPAVQSGSTVRLPASAFQATVGGSGTQVQYRAGATALGGMAGTSWDNNNQIFTVANIVASTLLAAKYALTSGSINAQTGTTYTLQSTDNGGVVVLTNAAAITLTAPAGLGAGFACLLIQGGAGQVTVAASGGATLGSLNGLTSFAGQYAFVNILALTANNFVIGGALA